MQSRVLSREGISLDFLAQAMWAIEFAFLPLDQASGNKNMEDLLREMRVWKNY